ncbi:DUF6799 domain-containing protein [Hymenobacter sp. DG25A]|uniref:DUF6799 domain-containing protein n=1 Tax=Hymenobacter sp. DG25A TaxID=1385663 RepID=UPI000B2BD8D6|nr:DUF6799 domain-containing protein [Hymenobacter sp. DG25A]
MKRFTYLTLALALFGLTAQAQSKKLPPRRPVAPKSRTAPTSVSLKEGYTIKDGKFLVTRSGHTDPVLQDETLLNGTRVKADGTVVLRDSTTVQMKEGDFMSLTGRVTTKEMRMEQDSLSKAAFQDTQKSKMKLKTKKGRRS